MKSIEEKRMQYLQNIDTVSRAVIEVDSYLATGQLDMLDVRGIVHRIIDTKMQPETISSLDILGKYADGVNYFRQTYGQEAPHIQAGKLFDFRPERFTGEISVESRGIALLIRFSHANDMLYARFSQRRDHFSQADQGAGFFRVVHMENQEIPVCCTIEGCDEVATTTHELTHLRNNIIGMNYYSRGGGRDVYEVYTYDDLQDEILAFFSEGYKRAQIQITLLHDLRYHFYRRVEGWGKTERDRYIHDVPRYVTIASEIRKIRGPKFLTDLAIIPLHQWARYLRVLKTEPNATKEI